MAVQLVLETYEGFPRMKKFFNSLIGRTLLVLLLVLAAAVTLPIIYQANPIVPSYVFKWTTVAGLGLAAGLGANLLLRERSVLVRLLAGTVALFAGLIISGWITHANIGIDLAKRPHTGLNWDWLAQLTFGGLFVLLATWTWRFAPKPKQAAKKSSRPRKNSSKSSKSPSGKRSQTPTSRAKSSPKRAGSSTAAGSRTTRVRNTTTKSQVKANGTIKSRKTTQSRTRKTTSSSRTRSEARTKKKVTIPKKDLPGVAQRQFWASQWNKLRLRTRGVWRDSQTTGKRVKSRLSPDSKKPKIKTRARSRMVLPSRQRRKEEHVHLAGVVEHRCPYCLEVVEKNDQRGVRVCPVCGTRHHADCWAVTGTCQVPHE